MKIDKVIVGDLSTNCYLLDIDNHVLIIDPGDEEDKIRERIGNRLIDGIIITHYHDDHIGALNNFLDIPIYDINNLIEGINTIGKFTFEMLKTPGHRSDAISIYFSNVDALFVGDFLFYESIGRTDLDDGNMLDMLKSLKKTKRFSDKVKIYPGHGPSTDFLHERKYNIYLRGIYEN